MGKIVVNIPSGSTGPCFVHKCVHEFDRCEEIEFQVIGDTLAIARVHVRVHPYDVPALSDSSNSPSNEFDLSGGSTSKKLVIDENAPYGMRYMDITIYFHGDKQSVVRRYGHCYTPPDSDDDEDGDTKGILNNHTRPRMIVRPAL